MIAALRADSTDLPVLLHVVGAMVLVGALVTVLALLLRARGGDSAALTRLAFRTLLLGALPAFILMRVSAEWARSETNADDEAAWVGIGYIVSDIGLLFLIAATVVARLGRSRPAIALTALMLAAYLVVVWAMTAKPL